MPNKLKVPDVIPHPEPADLADDLAWMKAVAIVFFGLRWQAAFAAATGIAPGHLHDIVRTNKQPGPVVRAKFLVWLKREEPRILDEAHYRLRLMSNAIRRLDTR